MSMMTHTTSETSVTFSLAELAKIEEERVREEDARRSVLREKEARERREAEARRRAAEAAEVAADAEARARRVREEASEKMIREARERAAVDVARIEAEAKVRLEADNAARAHELAVIRARAEAGHRRRERVLAVVLGLVLCGGSAAAYGATRQVATLEQSAEQLREQHLALGREREHAKTTELAALDRRYAALRARPLARDAEDARVTADAARNAIDAKALDHDRLGAFGDALDVFEARIETLEKITALDRRHADLVAWAGERRRPEVTAAARTAATRAKATGTSEALRAYDSALDQLRDALAQSTPTQGRPRPPQGEVAKGPCAPGDPGCDLDGHRLF